MAYSTGNLPADMLLLLPLALALSFRYATAWCTETLRTKIWFGHRRLHRLILAASVAGWWAMWNLNKVKSFWIPPIVCLGLFLVFSYSGDRDFLKLRWTFVNILRLAWWRTVSFVVSLLMVATGFEAILNRKLVGVAWIVGAGLVTTVGTGFFRSAEGMKLHRTKTGELRNRAFTMARNMGTVIQRVYIVPAGKGHLTNAFGASNAISLTDNLGKYLTKGQVDYVIAHELAHVKQRHGRKQFGATVTIFSVMGLLLFLLPTVTLRFRPLLDLMVIIVPIVTVLFLSRRFEYAADREALDFTGDPETAIRALAVLYHVSDAPTRCDRFTELF
jgi:Zn-dependent protease with chaperone function